MHNFEKEQKRKTEERALDTQLAEVSFFPESRESYEQQVGYSVKPISVYGKPTITFEKEEKKLGYTCIALFDVKQKLVAEGVEALVNCEHSTVDGVLGTVQVVSGIPIRKLK